MRVEEARTSSSSPGEADEAAPVSPALGADTAAEKRAAWIRALVQGGVAFVASRVMVLLAAGIVAATKQPRPHSALRPMLDVLTSWDGLWYLEVVRRGYPRSVPAPVNFFQLEARTAFFPVYPWLVRAADRVLPGGDTVAALAVNAVLGVAFVLLVGLLTRQIFNERVAGRAMVLACLFPGSFVLSFTYSEPAMLVLAAACLLALLRHRWILAGLLAGLATATRPNAVALVAASRWLPSSPSAASGTTSRCSPW